MIRAAFAALAFVILSLLLIAALAVIALVRAPWRGAVSMLYSRILCKMIGVHIKNSGQPVTGRPVLVIANHVSWVDVLVITASAPTIFVAKSEVASWPLVGWIAKIRGTVFVDRSRRHQTDGVNADIATRLAEGSAIVLFGEGTSSDGNRVLPFRTALLGAVNDALERMNVRELVVQPLSIGYTRICGLPMGRQHRQVAAWYGDVTMVPHLMTLITRGPVDVALTWGEPFALAAKTDRKAMARALETRVRRMTAATLRGRPLPPPLHLTERHIIDSKRETIPAEPATKAGAAG